MQGEDDMAKKEIPYYRIIALANLDLEEHMKENPKMLDSPGRVKWDVEETDYHYVAKGVIRIPVQIYFSKPESPDQDPEIRRVIVQGKREYDARLEELENAEQFENEKSGEDLGIDETKLQAQNMSQYRKNLRG